MKPRERRLIRHGGLGRQDAGGTKCVQLAERLGNYASTPHAGGEMDRRGKCSVRGVRHGGGGDLPAEGGGVRPPLPPSVQARTVGELGD